MGGMSTNVLAEEKRVIEDTLVYTDPTVAAAGQWLYGISIEAFDRTKASDGVNPATLSKDSGTINGVLPGVNLFVGYNNFTFTYHHKSGSSTTKYTNATGNWTQEEDGEFNEFSARWLIRDVADSFTPYLTAMAGEFTGDFVSTLDSGATWPVLGTRRFRASMRANYTSAGVGVIIPFNEKAGIRIDGGAVDMNATVDTGWVPLTGSGTGGRYTATVYYNFSENWNVQLGGRMEKINLGAIGLIERSGIYGMLGYTLR
jgi:hypothetical protein